MFQVYCGPVPQIDNGFATVATNVTYRGMYNYKIFFSRENEVQFQNNFFFRENELQF